MAQSNLYLESNVSSVDGLAHCLHRVSQHMDDLFAAATAGQDLTARQLVVLEIVAREDRPSQTTICARSGIDRSTIADMVRRLVKKGYLARRRSRADARRYAVQLTDEGRKVLERALPIAHDVERQVASRLPEKQRQHFISALRSILDKPEKGADFA
ncbi:MAG TPA: winged helix DNA-binding protein [Hyphomicrobium sp.]|nr:winged helix DNA-binding protein [Hyphomicrobium sp.]